MRIETSEKYPGRNKIVVEPGESDGLEPEILAEFAEAHNAIIYGSLGSDGYIIQFPDKKIEDLYPEDKLEDFLNICG